MGSGGRPRRRRRHAGAGPVAVAGRCGRSSRRSAVALRAPHSGVGGRARGERVAQAKLRGAHAQGRRRARWGPLCGPWDLASRKRCPGAEAGSGRVGSGGRPRRKRRQRARVPEASAGRCVRAGRRPVASLRVPHGGVDGRAGGVRDVQVGQQRAHVQGVGMPDEDLTEDRGVGGKQDASPGGGGGEEREDVRGPRRGGEHDVGRVRPRERRRGERDHRPAVHREAPSGAVAEEPD